MTEELQHLSPWADAAPSPYLRLQPGTIATLDVAFTYTHTPPGQFTFQGPATGSPHFVLHLNVRENDYYQNGIPGVTRSIEETAAWLDAVRRALGITTLRMIGASMGAYAALLFGDLLDADRVYAFSPVLRPGHLALGLASTFEDISPRLRAVRRRTTMMFGAFELGEYQFILPCLKAGMEMADLTLLANFHPGLLSIRFDRLFGGMTEPPTEELVLGWHHSALDQHDVGLPAALMPAIGQRDHATLCAVLGPLTRRDEDNPGLLYRLGRASGAGGLAGGGACLVPPCGQAAAADRANEWCRRSRGGRRSEEEERARLRPSAGLRAAARGA